MDSDYHKPFLPKGVPLLVLEQIEKLEGKAWAGQITRILAERRGRTTSPQVTTAIHRLRDYGFIERTGEADAAKSGIKRKLWGTTDKGKTALQEAVKLYGGFQRRPDMYDQAAS